MKLTKKYIKNVLLQINKCKNIYELNEIKSKNLGKKGFITKKMKFLKEMDLNKRKEFSIFINKIKKKIIKLILNKKNELIEKFSNITLNKSNIDITLSSKEICSGSLHIITKSIYKIQNFFSKLGCEVISGPEIESDYYNFDALNIKKDHPSRDSHDTFWFNKNFLLRTQTSSVQIRSMEVKKPPIRIVVPGKVYRNDSSLTHSPMFHQIEGLIVEKGISFSNLKWIMENFLYDFFKKVYKIRFRNSYFPFTTPSAEIDIFNNKSQKWLEVLGCGMVHPTVLKNVKINSKIYSGCAFGIGIERLIMLKYNLSNIRSFFKNDLRFLKQFK
ncbi:Phenylalanine--tRNA ligase alpha subunit [Buchnera aphidicola (Periphyllus testudinaceus)]|uniref:phenylalanine--tRNA ligase subunit alpha n=1 Tax=Buchnera aphidicola TaxID=9 RepID=UPI0034639D64